MWIQALKWAGFSSAQGTDTSCQWQRWSIDKKMLRICLQCVFRLRCIYLNDKVPRPDVGFICGQIQSVWLPCWSHDIPGCIRCSFYERAMWKSNHDLTLGMVWGITLKAKKGNHWTLYALFISQMWEKYWNQLTGTKLCPANWDGLDGCDVQFFCCQNIHWRPRRRCPPWYIIAAPKFDILISICIKRIAFWPASHRRCLTINFLRAIGGTIPFIGSSS